MTAPDFSLHGTATVTGAAGGIGSAVARGLAAAGADVACLDLAEEQVAAAMERAQSALGRVAHAVNCAGINNGAPALEMPVDQWRETVDVDLTGVFIACQAVGRLMAAGGGGSIVNIGSISASIANRGLAQAHYNASKAGVVHLSTSLALEWAPRNIRVNCVSPGYTKTSTATHPDVWEHVQAYAKDIPLARWAEPTEMVGPVVSRTSGSSSSSVRRRRTRTGSTTTCRTPAARATRDCRCTARCSGRRSPGTSPTGPARSAGCGD